MRRSLLIIPLVVCLPGMAQAQSAIGQQIQAAVQLYNSGDTAGAFGKLDSLSTTDPPSAQVFATLGNLRRQSQEWEASLVAYRRAQELSPAAPGLMYNLGLAYAFVDRDDEAITWLGRAKVSGFNVINVAGSPAAARLSDHSGYEHLFPTEEEYAHPFVEATRIIHDWSGEAAGDQFGWIARNVGDVDGDRINDAVSSAPTSSQSAGKIYVYSGLKGRLLWTVTGPDAGGQLGFGVEGAGDVNADGTPDVVAGAPFANKVFVYSGLDGSVLHTFEGSDPTGAFGASATGVGDANGDGHADVLVGEPYQIFGGPINSGNLSQTGFAHLYSGRDGRLLITHHGENAGDGFGATLSGKPDSDGALFVIGAPGAGAANRGRAYVYRNLETKALHTLEGAESGVSFGAMFLSVMGDADADGNQDIYVSDWADGALGPSTGRIYVFSGADGSTLIERGGETAGDGFGIGISDAGDVNGDGHDDLVVGAWQHASAAPSGGKLYVISGKDGELMHTVTGNVMGETLGFDTTGLGDVDGDGTVDFLVTSAWSGINGFQSGRTLVISGKPD